MPLPIPPLKKQYYKIYHYSSIPDLQSIDPNHYGEGITRGSECKYGKTGMNKSYYYTKDSPEICLKAVNRYEIYFPVEWKSQIYDRGDDPKGLYEQVKTEIKAKEKRNPYEHEMKDGVEQRIKELGYKGWQFSASPQLPHVIMLFYELPTLKPLDAEIIYDWQDNIIEINKSNYRQINYVPTLNFFCSQLIKKQATEIYVEKNVIKPMV